jgi:hypothetical protein
MVDWANMEFPNYLRIDFVRVYQRSDGSGTLGCDPSDMPTKDYIERHMEVYTNPNITTWAPGKLTSLISGAVADEISQALAKESID